MKRLLVLFFCAVGVASVSRAQLFSDDFTRVSDPGSLRSWTAFQGAWTVTNGVMLAGTNANASYGYAFTATNSFTNFSVQARIQLPVGAFAGGIGGRFTTNTGSHYAAWVYPEGSGGGALQFKLIRFSSYSSFTVLTNIALSSVGTNFHMVKLDMFGSQLTATFDTNQFMTFTDSTYASGGISLEFYTDTTPYVMTVDDVLVPSTLPVAINDSYSMTAGTTLTVSAPGVLSNDGGGSGPLTAVQGVGTAHGTLSLSANGSFTYTPTNGYTGADTFTYRANDGVTNSALATVTITINTNHAPVANDESYSTLTNTPLIIAAPGVLANDTDADSNPITAVQVVGPIHGTLSLNANGGFTYTPTNNYSGGDTFTYRANDGLTNSGIATASVTVVPATNLFFDSFTRANDPTNLTAPWVVSSGSFTVTGGQLKSGTNPPSFGYSFAYITNRWTNYVVSALLQFQTNGYGGGIGGRWDANFGGHYGAWLYPDNSPGGGNTLKLIRFSGASNSAPFAVLSQVNVPSVGTNFHTVKLAMLDTRIAAYLDGSLLLSVTDAILPSGTIASADMWTDTTPYIMSLENVTAKLLAIDDSYNVNAVTTATIPAPGVLANDTGVYGTNLTAVFATGPTHGILNLNANGGFTYTPTNNFVGTDTFTYQPNDGTASVGTATVTINVVAQNTPPTLSAQTNRTIVELSTLTVTNAGSDAETAPGSLTYTLSVTNPAGGTVTGTSISGAGVIAWTPTEAQGPSTNTFTTIVTDDGVPPLKATNSFIVVVLESNSPPSFVATPADRTVNELALMTVNNSATDSDLPANPLTYTLLVTNGVGVQVTNATITTAGVINWTPTESQGPSTNIFTTIVSDNNAAAFNTKQYFITNTFNVVVNEVNNAPTLPAQTNRTVLPQTAVTVTNTATDSNIPSATLTYTLTVTNASGLVSNAAITSDGIITWTPGYDQDQTTNVFTTIASNFNAIAVNAQRLSATNSFAIIVNGRPVIVTNSSALVAEGCVPTNNAIDAGETVTMSFSLKNAGLTNSANLVAALLETNGVASPSSAQTYGVLVAGGAAVSQSFTFTANGSCGNTITARLQLQDGALNLGVVSFPLTLGKPAVIFSENFDGVTAPALPAGWTTSSSGFQSNWVNQTSVRDTVPNAAFSIDATNVGINELVSPVITLPVGPSVLAFRNNYNLEAATGIGYDGGVLEIRIGSSTNYTDIITAGGSWISGGYNLVIDNSVPGYHNPLTNRPVWSGNSGGFTNTVVNLPASSAGQDIQLRWRCGTDNGNAAVGWRIDTISITGRVCCANSTPLLPAQTNQTIPEGALLQVTNTVTSLGSPANPINYGLLVAPSGATIDTNGIITWTPTEAQGPSTNIFVTAATNSGVPVLYTTNSFTVYVTEVNSAPVLPATTNYTIAELTTLTVTNTAFDSDIPTNVLTYTLTVSNDTGPVTNAVISTNGIITWTPNEAQGPSTNLFTTVVTDNGSPPLNATNTFTVVVYEINTPPVLPAQTNRTIAELTLLTVTNTATDSDIPVNALSYSLTVTNGAGVVTNATISANGTITWMPTEAQGPSTNTFITIVTDNNPDAVNAQSLSATNTFTVIVNEVNSAPILPGVTNYTINELTTVTVTNTATDSDIPANTLSYALSVTNAAGLVTNASISASGIITWTPTEAQGPSTNTFTTIVTDNGTPPLSATNSFTVVVNEVNSAPVLPDTTNYMINELTTLTVTNTATDSDLPANTLTYALSVSNAAGSVTNASISASGIIAWTPTEAQGPSTNTFTTIVTDNGAPPLSATNSFTVVVNEVNSAPALPDTTNYTINELTTLTVTNTATDSDLPANTLTYALSVSNAAGFVTNASISASGIITWTPTEAQGPSTNTFTTIVTDNGTPPLSATNSFIVVVNEMNSAPVLPDTTNYTINELTTLTVTNTATDSDIPANTLAYSLIVANAAGFVTNASISASGIITWTPTEAQGPSTNTFTTLVTDNGTPPMSATNNFTVIVNEVNSAPDFIQTPANQTIAELSTLTVTNAATDSDIPANILTYALSASNASGPVTNASISAAGVITWTPNYSQAPSTNTFVTIVNDNGVPDLSATNSFLVVVTAISNAPPTAPVINSITLDAGVATISWSAVSNRTYRLQYAEALTNIYWNDVPPDIQATNSTASATNSVGEASQRFYRVILLP